MEHFLDILKTLGATAAIGSFGLLIGLVKRVGKHDITLYGEDGTNGLRGFMRKATVEIKALNEWKIREDTISEIESELIQETGRLPERLRDKVKEA